MKQETVTGSGISWAVCKTAPRSRQTTTPAPHHSFFTGRMPFLPPNQQRQSTEGTVTNRPANYKTPERRDGTAGCYLLSSTITMFTRLTCNALILSGGLGLRRVGRDGSMFRTGLFFWIDPTVGKIIQYGKY